jgi:hypothetical protein
MYLVCPGCGQYCEEKEIDQNRGAAICPFCGYAHQFIQQPLFIVSGASGTGKSTSGLELVKALPECVVLESDILWGSVAASPADDYHSYRNVWLRMANNIGQSGRPVVYGSSTSAPGRFALLPTSPTRGTQASPAP